MTCSTRRLGGSGRRLGAWLAAAVVAAAAAPAAAGGTPTVDELTAAIRRNREVFFGQKSYRFHYDLSSEIREGGTFAYKSFEVTNVRRGSDLHTSVHFPRGSLRGEEEMPEHTRELIYYKAAAIDHQGVLTMISPRIFTQHFNHHHYTDYQHLDAYKDLPETAGKVTPFEISQPFLPETIEKSRKSYRVREAPEAVDGASCWVLERPGVDVIWVDPEGLIRQRLLYWGKGQPRSVLTRSLDYKPVLAGLKLPMKLVVDHYANPSIDPKELWDKVAYELTIRMKDCEFNNVKDQDFLYTPPVGSIVNDYFRRVQYRVPKEGEKPFQVALSVAELEQTPRTYYLILANGLLFGLILAVVMWRRVRQAYRRRYGSKGAPADEVPGPIGAGPGALPSTINS
jgi:hypothetical protein